MIELPIPPPPLDIFVIGDQLLAKYPSYSFVVVLYLNCPDFESEIDGLSDVVPAGIFMA